MDHFTDGSWLILVPAYISRSFFRCINGSCVNVYRTCLFSAFLARVTLKVDRHCNNEMIITGLFMFVACQLV